MRVTTVESTVLATVGYDEARPQNSTCNSCRASKGSYFNQAIRGRFPFCLICEWHASSPDAPCWPDAAVSR